jgi:hypothetical protein
MGVRFSAIVVAHTPDAMTFEGIIPVDLAPYDQAIIQEFATRNRS